MKNREKVILLSGALIVLIAAFVVDKHQCPKDVDNSKRLPLVKPCENLCVKNVTGSQVKAALYTKRMRRRGDVVNLKTTGKSKIKRSKQAPILAVARRQETLGEHLNSSVPHVKTNRTKCVTVKNKGYDLMVTPSSCKKNCKS